MALQALVAETKVKIVSGLMQEDAGKCNMRKFMEITRLTDE